MGKYIDTYMHVHMNIDGSVHTRKIIQYSWNTNKCVFSSLTRMVGPTMNLISETNYLCEKKKYVLMYSGSTE
jgi:hypothetical protein